MLWLPYVHGETNLQEAVHLSVRILHRKDLMGRTTLVGPPVRSCALCPKATVQSDHEMAAMEACLENLQLVPVLENCQKRVCIHPLLGLNSQLLVVPPSAVWERPELQGVKGVSEAPAPVSDLALPRSPLTSPLVDRKP